MVVYNREEEIVVFIYDDGTILKILFFPFFNLEPEKGKREV